MRGTCYAHAASAVIGAALFRKNSRHSPIPPEYIAVVAATTGENSNGNKYQKLNERIDRLANSSETLRTITDGGGEFAAAVDILNRERAPIDVDPKLWEKKLQSFDQHASRAVLMERVRVDEIVSTITKLQKKRADIDSQLLEHENVGEVLVKAAPSLEARLRSPDPAVQARANRDAQAMKVWVVENKRLLSAMTETDQEIIAARSEMEANYDWAATMICNASECFRQNSLAGPSADLRDFNGLKSYTQNMYLDRKNGVLAPGYESADQAKPCSDADNGKVLDAILRNLCVGLPPMISLASRHLSIRLKETNKWEPYPAEGGGHALAVIGIETLEDGIPYLLLRDSNAGGSISRLPLSNVCRIHSVSSVGSRKPVRGEPIAETTAWAMSSVTHADGYAKQAYEVFRSRVASGLIVLKLSSDGAKPESGSTMGGMAPSGVHLSPPVK